MDKVDHSPVLSFASADQYQPQSTTPILSCPRYTYAADKPFLLAARAAVPHDPIQDGHYFLKETILERTVRQTVEELSYDDAGGSYWRIAGTLHGAAGSALAVPYRLTFSVDGARPLAR